MNHARATVRELLMPPDRFDWGYAVDMHVEENRSDAEIRRWIKAQRLLRKAAERERRKFKRRKR